MAEMINAAPHGRSSTVPNSDILTMDAESIGMLKEQYECRHFRILVIGRANAGKTTILEKICGVAQGTKPIIYDGHGDKLKANIKPKSEPEHVPNLKPRFINQLFNRKPSATHLTPSVQVRCKMYEF